MNHLEMCFGVSAMYSQGWVLDGMKVAIDFNTRQKLSSNTRI